MLRRPAPRLPIGARPGPIAGHHGRMQTTDALAGWRRPPTWRRPGRVALANAARVAPAEPMHAALLAAGADVVPAPLREAGGGVAATVAGSDVVVSGGAPLD